MFEASAEARNLITLKEVNMTHQRHDLASKNKLCVDVLEV
jgi:hypothetical protein